jgi:hypothetical protein
MYMDEIIGDIDPNAGSVAFEALQPRLATLTEVRATTTDIRKALIHAASIGRMVLAPEMLAAFQTLPADRFDMEHVELLQSAALATWHAALCLRTAGVQGTAAKVPEDIIISSTEVKQRMIKVLDYVVGTVDGVGDQVADIRGGTGYIDRADDMMRLADMYDIHIDAISGDSIHYRDTDATTARTLAHSIYMVLGDGRSSDVRYWTDYQARAWTFLITTYDEVAAAGRWLFRHENGDALFPSLYAVGRQPRRGRRGGDELPEDGGGELPADGGGEIGAPVTPAP